MFRFLLKQQPFEQNPFIFNLLHILSKLNLFVLANETMSHINQSKQKAFVPLLQKE